MAKSKKLQHNQTQQSHHSTHPDINLTQNNVYHMGASEIDALHRMQDSHPDIVKQILSFRQQEIDIQKDIIAIEQKEQETRIKEMPYIRTFTFLGQLFAYSLSVGCLVGGFYFGSRGDYVIAGLFLGSSLALSYVQYTNRNSK